MKQSRTTLKLTAAAIGVFALFAAATAAGVSRGEEMNTNGAFAAQSATSAITGQSAARSVDIPESERSVHRI